MKRLSGTYKEHSYIADIEYAQSSVPETQDKYIVRLSVKVDGTSLYAYQDTIWNACIEEFPGRTEQDIVNRIGAYIDRRFAKANVAE